MRSASVHNYVTLVISASTANRVVAQVARRRTDAQFQVTSSDIRGGQSGIGEGLTSGSSFFFPPLQSLLHHCSIHTRPLSYPKVIC
jgi:hypothetical protein